MYAPVVAADGTLYFGLRSGLHAVDPRGPRLLRERTAPLERVMSPPALGADGTIYLVATGQPVPVMRAIHPDGTLKWETTIPGRARARNTPPVVGADGKVYVGVANLLTCFAPEGDGKGGAKIVWQMAFPRQFEASPVIAEKASSISGSPTRSSMR